MAKHESLDGRITAAGILENMSSRYSFLYSSDRYNGQDAVEFGVLESILCEVSSEGFESADNFATLVDENGGGGGEWRGDSLAESVPTPFPSPRLLYSAPPITFYFLIMENVV